MNTNETVSEIAVLQILPERRRPGRRAEVNVALLPLLRREEREALSPLDIEHDADRLIEAPRALRGLGDGQGIVLALGVGLVMWAALIAAGMELIKAVD